MLGSAGHKVSLKGQQVGQQIISQYVEQRAKSRGVLAELGKTKGQELGILGRGKRYQPGALRALRWSASLKGWSQSDTGLACAIGHTWDE